MEILPKEIDEKTGVGLLEATEGMSAAVVRRLLRLRHGAISSNREAPNKTVVGRVARAMQAAAGGTAESDELGAVATEEPKDCGTNKIKKNGMPPGTFDLLELLQAPECRVLPKKGPSRTPRAVLRGLAKGDLASGPRYGHLARG